MYLLNVLDKIDIDQSPFLNQLGVGVIVISYNLGKAWIGHHLPPLIGELQSISPMLLFLVVSILKVLVKCTMTIDLMIPKVYIGHSAQGEKCP